MTKLTSEPRDGARTVAVASVVLAVFLLAIGSLGGCGGSHPPAPPGFTATIADSTSIRPETDSYRVLVDDELTLTVLGSPELSGTMRVLPDGTVTIPGIGSIYVLGSTVPEVQAQAVRSLAAMVRYPQASVAVTNYGERRVFVMGEVVIPGDHAYHHGLSVMGAIAQAGGFNNAAKRSSVIVLRRLGPEQAVAFRVDLTGPLKGKDLDKDLPVRPFDIIYVPKTFIASVNVLMDQYFRQLTPPFTLYLSGWNAFHIATTKVRLLP